uniref:Uncharacterized protein n=1 Tax=Leptospirillum ferrodiazotrophum TaxID=412449 RepID=C6HZY3_9BACT|nr:MAG: hypothetical protein UBAL3_95450141 [Leptospirillum ferrodiazotrophum]
MRLGEKKNNVRKGDILAFMLIKLLSFNYLFIHYFMVMAGEKLWKMLWRASSNSSSSWSRKHFGHKLVTPDFSLREGDPSLLLGRGGDRGLAFSLELIL